MSEAKNSPGVGPILKLGEEKLTQLLTQLLSNETFVSALQGAISSGLKAKGTVDRSMVSLLSTFNVPTLEDVSLLRGKLQELEDAVADLAKTVATVESRTTAPEKKKGRAKKHAADEE